MPNTYVYQPLRYFTFVFVATFALWGIGGYLSFSPTLSGAYMLPMLAGLMVPFIVAVRMIWSRGDKALRHDFVTRIVDPKLIEPVVFVTALLLMPLSVLVSIGVSVLCGGSISQFAPAGAFSFSGGFVPVLLLLLLAAAFEELGWRGYGFESLHERFGFLGASLLFGILWSAWHLPLLFVKGSYQHQILLQSGWYAVNFYGSTVVMGVIISWVCAANRRSILAAVIFHFVINLSQEALSMTQEAKVIQTGVLALAAMLIVLANRELYFPPRQRRPAARMDSRTGSPGVCPAGVGISSYQTQFDPPQHRADPVTHTELR